MTLADWTGMVETELFAQTYKSYGLATVRYPVLEVTATVEPFENGRGFSLRVLRAGKPRTSIRRAGGDLALNLTLDREMASHSCWPFPPLASVPVPFY